MVEDISVHSFTPKLAQAAARFFTRHFFGKETLPATLHFEPYQDAVLASTQRGQVLADFPDAEFVFDATMKAPFEDRSRLDEVGAAYRVTACRYRLLSNLRRSALSLVLLTTLLALRAEVAIDEKEGGAVTLWKWQGKTLIDKGGTPLASALELELGDGKKTAFHVETCQTNHIPGAQEWRLEGRVGPIPAELTYRYEEEAGRLTVTTLFRAPAEKISVAELRWQQSLTLQPRKKIWFLGEHGIEWESRYFYQFFARVTGDLLTPPDRNEWRWFGFDQLGSGAFRLWKAESCAASPLIMQEGKKALPALQCFDETGGVTLHMPGLAGLPAGRLLVDAERGGELRVLYHSHHGFPLSGATIYDAPHTFMLEADTGESERKAKREALAKTIDSTPPAAEEVMQEEAWLVKAPKQGEGPLYVHGGYPFARGELPNVASLTVKEKGQWRDKPLPVQAKPLAYWPDGSVKWAQVTFPMTLGGKMAEGAPYISLRNGERFPVKLETSGKKVEAEEHAEVRENGDTVMLKSGGLEVELTKGTRWLKALRLGKESLLSDRPARFAYCDYTIEPEPPFPFDRMLRGGKADRGELVVERIDVEERGPLRAVVRMEGWVNNKERTRVILRLTALAGRPELQITHSVQFCFTDPRKTFLTGMGLELPLKAAKGVRFGTLSPEENAETLLQSTPFSLQYVNRRGSDFEVRDTQGAAPWLWKAMPKGGVVAAIRDFRKMAPSALAWDGDREVLRVELWPDLAVPNRHSAFLR